MRRLPLLFALLLTACPEKPDTGDLPPTDQDADGYTEDEDCDDLDAAVHPDAVEACNGTDDDCDGAVDEDVATTFYLDSDADGHGNPAATTAACERPDGWAAAGDDCDDDEPSVHTGASEVCNGVDDDCDGAIDDAPVDIRTWYADSDEDGYGDDARAVDACDQPVGWVGQGGDCDDDEPAVNPAATEICNGLDDDCSGEADEPSAADAATWYADTDADGHGDAAVSVVACEPPAGFVDSDDDCDDTEGTTHPDAAEYCNGTDDDCDGTTDEDGAVDALTYYADADLDGFGDPATGSITCTQPSGTVQDAGDCNDTDPAIHPGAVETCDGVDQDCDGTVDDGATDALTWYGDADGDGYGDPSTTTLACTEPAGFTGDTTDCDDRDAAVHPGATEVCDDGLDGDCDGAVDEGCPIHHCGTITADETWAAGVHDVTCDVYVHGSAAPVLTIADGAEITFAPGTGLIVGNGDHGALDVLGTAGLGVLFTSDQASPAAGDWKGLQFGAYDDGSVLEYTTVEYGGGNGHGGVWAYHAAPTLTGCTLRANANAGIEAQVGEPAVTDTTIQDNTGYGVDAHTGGLADGFSGNVITGNGEAPVYLLAASAGALDASGSYAGNADDRVILAADDVEADSTWQALDVPWSVSGDVRVIGSAGPVLTIADGAVLEFATGTGLTIGTSNHGKLVIDGASLGVVMTAASGVSGGWDGLYFGYYDDGSVLEGLLIEYGGGNGYGDIYAYGADPTLIDCLVASSSHSGFYGASGAFPAIAGTAFEDNAGYGVSLDTSSGLSTVGEPSFTGNTVTSNALVPITLPGNFVGQIASDNTLAGNGTDAVYVQGDTLDMDATWRLLDVPYQVIADQTVVGTAAPVLTLADGVELYFDAGAGLLVGTSSHGGLRVEGTSLGVLMTSSSASPTHGAWDGLTLGYYTDAAEIDGLTLTWGGANTFGGIRLYNTTAELTDCTLVHNANAGIYVTNGTVAISGSTLSDNDGYGLELSTSGYLAASSTAHPSGPTFQDNVLTGNADRPAIVTAASIGQLDASSSFTGNTSDVIAVWASTVDSDATWQALDVDLRFDGDVYIQGTAIPTVTVQAGASLTFSAGVGLFAGSASQGGLVVLGTLADPVVFTSAQASPAPGDWDGVTFGPYATAASGLEHASVRYGGANGYGNVYFYYSNGHMLDSFSGWSSRWGVYRNHATPTLSGLTYAGNVAGDLY